MDDNLGYLIMVIVMIGSSDLKNIDLKKTSQICMMETSKLKKLMLLITDLRTISRDPATTTRSSSLERKLLNQ